MQQVLPIVHANDKCGNFAQNTRKLSACSHFGIYEEEITLTWHTWEHTNPSHWRATGIHGVK